MFKLARQKLLTCLLSWAGSLLLLPSLGSAACNLADVGGTAYLELPIRAFSNGEEANAYGSRQADNEKGIAGLTVKVTDNSGTIQTAITDDNGQWSVNSPSFPVRVEYQPSTGLYSGPVGAASKSSVQFLSSPSCTADLGLQYPEDYSQILPPLLLPSYVSGAGDTYNDPALSTYPYNANASYQGTSIASLSEVGSLWGMAWQPNKKRIFGATVLKRHVGIRDGLGYVYVFDQQSQPGSLVAQFDLQGKLPANGGAAIDLGSVCRDSTCAATAGYTGIASDYVLPEDRSTASIDLDAFFKVGRVGFGDTDIQPNSNTLWLVNTQQKALISVDVSNPDPTKLPGIVNQYVLDNLAGLPSCVGGELRPWGLGFNRSMGYLGLSCDAITSQDPNDLRAYVMQFDPANMAAGLSKVYDFPLKYTRDPGFNRPFNPWLTPSQLPQLANIYNQENSVVYPQGLLSDIEFDEQGNIYVEVMDLFGAQHGRRQLPPLSQATSPHFDGIAEGDLLKICKTSTGYSIEGSAECPASALVAQYVGPGGNGEFFNDRSVDANPESALGGLALLKGSRELISVVVDPHDPAAPMADPQYIYTQGFTVFSLESGGVIRWHTTATNQPGLFGKSAGVGDLELLTDPAPIELGNRVWIDTDADGIQDPEEVGVAGVEVKLQCSQDSQQVATVTTNAAGEYLFSNASNASFIDEDESCSLSIAPNQAPLTSYKATLQNAEGQASNEPNTDLHDSDAVDQTGSAVIEFSVGKSGQNNHSLDFGFKLSPVTDVALTKTLNKTTVKRGEQVQYTLSVTNESQTNAATQVEIKDLLPAGLTYLSDDGVTVYGADVYNETTGIWLVGDLPVGTTKNLNIMGLVQ